MGGKSNNKGNMGKLLQLIPLFGLMLLQSSIAASVVKTIMPYGGGDFTNLATWEAWADDQTNAAQWAECYAGGDLGAVTLSGWATTPTTSAYPRIYVAEGNKHTGKDESVGAYIIDNLVAISSYLPYLRVEGLRIDVTNGSVYTIQIFEANQRYDSLLIRSVASNDLAGLNQGVFVIYNTDEIGPKWTNIVLRNCVEYGKSFIGQAIYFVGDNFTSRGVYEWTIQNCTFYDNHFYGSYFESLEATTTVSFVNTAIIGTNFDYSADISLYEYTDANTVRVNYCAGGDATCSVTNWGGLGNKTNVAYTAAFVSTTDLTAKVSGPLYNTGTNLSGSFRNDITHQGNWRPASVVWDMGAFQHQVPTQTNFMHMLNIGIGGYLMGLGNVFEVP